jgi:hypothetical protein
VAEVDTAQSRAHTLMAQESGGQRSSEVVMKIRLGTLTVMLMASSALVLSTNAEAGAGQGDATAGVAVGQGVAPEAPVIVRNGDDLRITGTILSENFTMPDPWTFSHTPNFSGEPTAPWDVSGAPNCELVGGPKGRSVTCDGTGITRITFKLGGYEGDPNPESVSLHSTLPAPSPVVRVIGGSGPDTLNATYYSGPTRMNGGAGNDMLRGSLQRDVAFGGSGRDIFAGNGGNDYLEGREGPDVLLGDLESQCCTDPGLVGDDILDGGDGNDLVVGNLGSDYVGGGSGDDRLDGGEGPDRVFGGEDEDVLRGREGRDSLNGDHGSDVLYAGPGNDVAYSTDLHDDDVNCGHGIDSVMSDWRDLLFQCERRVP